MLAYRTAPSHMPSPGASPGLLARRAPAPLPSSFMKCYEIMHMHHEQTFFSTECMVSMCCNAVHALPLHGCERQLGIVEVAIAPCW